MPSVPVWGMQQGLHVWMRGAGFGCMVSLGLEPAADPVASSCQRHGVTPRGHDRTERAGVVQHGAGEG